MYLQRGLPLTTAACGYVQSMRRQMWTFGSDPRLFALNTIVYTYCSYGIDTRNDHGHSLIMFYPQRICCTVTIIFDTPSLVVRACFVLYSVFRRYHRQSVFWLFLYVQNSCLSRQGVQDVFAASETVFLGGLPNSSDDSFTLFLAWASIAPVPCYCSVWYFSRYHCWYPDRPSQPVSQSDSSEHAGQPLWVD